MFKRVLFFVGLMLLASACGASTLLDQVSLEPDTIAPRAGSLNSTTTIRYTLTQAADVSIYLVDAQGKRNEFRKDQPRTAGTYAALFSGAVDNRVLPDGKYAVVIEAKDPSGKSARVEKPLTIVNADSVPPEFQNFTVFPDSFTPNQDGIDDRVTIRYWLTKPARVDVFLSDGKNRYEVAERKTTICIKDDKSCPARTSMITTAALINSPRRRRTAHTMSSPKRWMRSAIGRACPKS